MEAYSEIAGVMAFVLVAGLFIMFLILDSPKYESTVESSLKLKKQPLIRYSLNVKFEAVNGLLSGLNVAFSCTVMLVILFLLTLIFLVKAA